MADTITASPPATAPAKPAAQATPSPPAKPSAAAALPPSDPPKSKAQEPPPPTAQEKEDDEFFEMQWDKLKDKLAPKPATPPPATEDSDQEPTPDGQKPPAKAPDAQGKDKTPPPKVEGIKAVRDQLEKVSGELKQERESRSQLQAKLAELETKAKDSTTMAERLAAREKEVEDLQANLRALKQEASPEFVEKYDKPFNQAAELAKAEIDQLAIVNPETGEAVRKADFSRDFASIYNLDRAEAKLRAKQLFGEDAVLVMEHYQALKRLDMTRKQALDEEKTKYTEKEKAQAAQAAQQREAIQAAEVKVRQDLLTKHADWYGEDPNDPEGNGILKEGEAFVNYKPQTFQQAVLWKTRLQLNAAAFPRELARNAKLREEVTALKAQIEELKASAPGQSTKRPSGVEAAPKDMGILEELRSRRDEMES